MEIKINDKVINLEAGNIYGLIMEDRLIKDNNTLVNNDYYEEVELLTEIEKKIATLIGVKDGKSFTNNKRKWLAKMIALKNNYLIIENFFSNFTYIDSNAFIKLFRNLCKKHNLIIVIKENDTNFLIENCDYLINYTNLSMVNKHDYYLLDYGNLDKPDILEFTNLVLEKNIKIKYFYNRLDLLKSLYRLVM